MELDTLYDNRFSTEDREAKDAIWRVLCRHFFQRYVPRDATVLDLGAGFCEFLRHIECKERIAVDLNQQVSKFAPAGTRVIVSPSQSLRDEVDDNSIDIVFASNFFEHLLRDIHRNPSRSIPYSAPWGKDTGASAKHTRTGRVLLGLC